MAVEQRRSSGRSTGRSTGNYLPLRDVMERLFDGSMVSPQMMGGQVGLPAANLRVTDDNVILEMAIPGVDAADINIAVSGDTVTVSGEVIREQSEQRGQTYLEEIWDGTFQRSFVLPFPVDADRADATFDNGVLKITLPKSESAKPRKVRVSGQRKIDGQSQRKSGEGAQGTSDSQKSEGQKSEGQRTTGQTQSNEQRTDQAPGDVQKERVPTGSGQQTPSR